jgi:DNA-directed RNA polymerase alpha subunit
LNNEIIIISNFLKQERIKAESQKEIESDEQPQPFDIMAIINNKDTMKSIIGFIADTIREIKAQVEAKPVVKPSEEVVSEKQEIPITEPNDPRLLSIEVNELMLSYRAYNCLTSNKVKTIGDLIQYSEKDLMKFRNMGNKSLAEIKQVLAELGLSLQD